MTAALKTKLTVQEYLAIESRAEFKSDFFHGEMSEMSENTIRHNLVRQNLSGEIGIRLKGGPFRSVSSSQRILVSRTGIYTAVS